MYRIVYDQEVRIGCQPMLMPGQRRNSAFARVPLTEEEQGMSRMTFDGLLLQSQLPEGEVMTLEFIAENMFCRQGEPVGMIARSRAKQAANNLIALGNARAYPNKKEMIGIRSTASQGTQLAAVMSLSIRRSVQNRRDSDRLNEVDGHDTGTQTITDYTIMPFRGTPVNK